MFDLKDYALNITFNDKEFRKETYKKRLEIISIAASWKPSPIHGEHFFYDVWTYEKDTLYEVSLGKPGKEYYQKQDGNIKNVNDMWPVVKWNDVPNTKIRGGFNDIFRLLSQCKKDEQKDVLRAFVVLFLRNAFLLDHEVKEISGKKYYSYNPIPKLIEFICENQPEFEDVPMEVYIHFLDAIALNEDVKYWTKGRINTPSKDFGRVNNMRTYIYCICCHLGLMEWHDYAYSLITSGGVATIPYPKIVEYFPELNVKYKPRKKEESIPESASGFVSQEAPQV